MPNAAGGTGQQAAAGSPCNANGCKSERTADREKARCSTFTEHDVLKGYTPSR
jgi:hypothetical protein